MNRNRNSFFIRLLHGNVSSSIFRKISPLSVTVLWTYYSFKTNFHIFNWCQTKENMFSTDWIKIAWKLCIQENFVIITRKQLGNHSIWCCFPCHIHIRFQPMSRYLRNSTANDKRKIQSIITWYRWMIAWAWVHNSQQSWLVRAKSMVEQYQVTMAIPNCNSVQLNTIIEHNLLTWTISL